MPKRHRFWRCGAWLQNAVGASKGAGDESSIMESIPGFRWRKGANRGGLRPVEAVAGDLIVSSVSQKPRDESAVPEQLPWPGQSGHDSQGRVGPDERFIRLDDNDRVESTDIQLVAIQQGPGEIGLDGSEVEHALRIVPQYPSDPTVAKGAMSVVENDRVVHGPSSLRQAGVSRPSPSSGQIKKEFSVSSGRFRFGIPPQNRSARVKSAFYRTSATPNTQYTTEPGFPHTDSSLRCHPAGMCPRPKTSSGTETGGVDPIHI